MSAPKPDVASLAQFAVLAGLKPAYARELKLRGRLVLTDDGQVRVRESAERMHDASVADVLPELATLSDFAVLARCAQSYASQLKAEGRLVLTDDGKRVRVAESLAQIRDTQDPAKAGVTARHTEARGAALNLPPDTGDDDGDLDDDDDATAEAAAKAAGSQHRGAFHQARARRETAQAEMSEMELAQRRGELLDRADVRSACAAAVTEFRTRLESLSTTLGPQLAPVADEARCIALLAEHHEQLLEELARKFRAMAPEVSA